MVVTEDTSQLERSALIPVSWKSVFMFVTFDVSKHLITSLFTELSVNLSLALLSFKTTLSGQGDWEHVIQLAIEHRLPVNISSMTFPSRFQLQI